MELDVAKYGDNIALTVPSVDRGRYDPRNLIGVVLAVNSDGSFKIGVKGGILKGTYLRTCACILEGLRLSYRTIFACPSNCDWPASVKWVESSLLIGCLLRLTT